MELNFWQTISIALISSVFSILVTYLFRLWENSRNFKRDYYKKIIDKRINAYERVIAFNESYRTIVSKDEDCRLVFACGYDEFIK